MKFVFFGSDHSLSVLNRLLVDGHEWLGLCSFSIEDRFLSTQKILEKARVMGVGAITRPLSSVHIDDFVAQGAQIFISAGYLYKIPDIHPAKAYAINAHPAYLPLGRGLMPTPYILLENPDAAGITIHKVSNRFDAGDIVYQEKILLCPRETTETYAARVAIALPDIISRVTADIGVYWNHAIPQDESRVTRAPLPDDAMRRVDVRRDGVDRMDRVMRVFGSVGVICRLATQASVLLMQADVWKEKHDYPAGTVVLESDVFPVIALHDGFMLVRSAQNISE